MDRLEPENAWRMLVDDRFGAFVRYLAHYCFFEVDDISYMIEKPWKYFPEWNEFIVWFEEEKDK